MKFSYFYLGLMALIASVIGTGDVCAQTIMWTGEGPLNDVNYYIYNIGQKEFLNSLSSSSPTITQASTSTFKERSKKFDILASNNEWIGFSYIDYYAYTSFTLGNTQNSWSLTKISSNGDYGDEYSIKAQTSISSKYLSLKSTNKTELVDNTNNNHSHWHFISKEQYDAIITEPSATLKNGIGDDAVVMEQIGNIKTYKTTGTYKRWMASNAVNGTGKYLEVKVTNVPRGRYNLEVYAYANATKTITDGKAKIVANEVSENLSVASNTNGNWDASLKTIQKVTVGADNTLSMYVQVDDENVKNVYIILKDIIPYHDEGSFLTNAGFDESPWNKGWEGTSSDEKGNEKNSKFSLQRGAANNAYPTNTNFAEMFAEISSATDQALEAGNIYQTITLAAGAYRLSADIAARNRYGYLYAKIGDREQKIKFTGEKKNHKLTFVVPSKSLVTIGFKHNKENPLGYSKTDDTKKNIWMAIDNVRLVRTGDAEGADISTQIINADLSKNDGYDDNGLSLTDEDGWKARIQSNAWYGWDFGCAEIYFDNRIDGTNKKIDTYQTITGLPDGWYKFKAQGFYRDGRFASDSQDRDKTFIYANNAQKNLCNIKDESFTPNSTTYSSGGGYPNSMYEASKAFEDENCYGGNEVLGHVTDGTLDIGIKREDGIEYDWMIFNKFSLYYMGEELDEVVDFTTLINNFSFETGDLTGWTVDDAANQTVISSPSTQFDGNYVLKFAYGQLEVSQTISGLTEGTYSISLMVENADMSELSYTIYDENNTPVKTDNYSIDGDDFQVVTLDNISISKNQKVKLNFYSFWEDAIIDCFKISMTGAPSYLYNRDAGLFLTTPFEAGSSDYSVTNIRGKNYGIIGLANEGSHFFINKENNNDLFTIQKSDAVIYIEQCVNNNSKREYLRLNKSNDLDSDKNKIFKIANQELGSRKCRISINPSNVNFGQNVIYQNSGTYNSEYTIGNTIVGWIGENSYLLVNPLIPEDYSANCLSEYQWEKMSKVRYDRYKEKLASAYEARKAAWPIIKSIKRSTTPIDVFLTDCYYDLESTAEEINEAADLAKKEILSIAEKASDGEYVDLSFLLDDAACELSSGSGILSHAGTGEFRSDDVSYRTSNKIFGGRYYQCGGNPISPRKYLKTLTVKTNKLPAGKYELVLDINASHTDMTNTAVNGVAVIAGTKGTNLNIPAKSAKFNIIECAVPFILDGTEENISLGVEIMDESNAKWVAFDNFRIRCYGEIKQEEEQSLFDYSLTEDGKTMKFKGTINKDLAPTVDYALKNNTDVLVVDFTDATIKTGEGFDNLVVKEVLKQENALVYAKEDAKIERSKNIIKGTTCENFVITDKKQLYVPAEFTAQTATYSRDVTVASGSEYTWSTLVLPFSINKEMDQNNNIIGFYKVESIDSETPKLIFAQLSSPLDAHTPVLLKAKGNISIATSDATVKKTSDLRQPNSNDPLILYGSYERTLVGVEGDKTDSKNATNGINARDCYYVKNNSFKIGNGWFYNTPFRAYVYKGKDNAADAKFRYSILDIFIDEDLIADEIKETNDNNENSIERIFDTKGIKHNSLQKGLNLIRYSDGTIRKQYVK